MFNLICALIVALLGVVGLLIPVYEVHIVGLVLLIISGLWLFASFVNNLICYTAQVERFEKIRAGLKRLEISKEKQNNLISEFKIYLADKYPDLEKEIFKLITESKSDVHMILNYPELKSSDTLLALVSQINKLAEEVYNSRHQLEYEYSYVRFYNANQWFYLRPNVPNDISKLL